MKSCEFEMNVNVCVHYKYTLYNDSYTMMVKLIYKIFFQTYCSDQNATLFSTQ